MEDQVKYYCAQHELTRRTYLDGDSVVTVVLDGHGRLIGKHQIPTGVVLTMASLCAARDGSFISAIERRAKDHACSVSPPICDQNPFIEWVKKEALLAEVMNVSYMGDASADYRSGYVDALKKVAIFYDVCRR